MRTEGNEEYEDTPSQYNSTEFFTKYLGRTSYYTLLQSVVTDLATTIDPTEILELGTGTGDTAIRLSNELPDTPITAIDNRETAVEEARGQTEAEALTFAVGDMTEYVATTQELPELVVMLYSFHHIPDPLRHKKDFLRQCYRGLPDGGYLCIAEGFLSDMDLRETELSERWEQRKTEAYASTFWASLDGLDADSIADAQQVGEFSARHEQEAGENVIDRDGEYLVSRDWVEYQAGAKGLDVVLSEPCNSLGEGVVLLQK